jgi:hypothetical protein
MTRKRFDVSLTRIRWGVFDAEGLKFWNFGNFGNFPYSNQWATPTFLNRLIGVAPTTFLLIFFRTFIEDHWYEAPLSNFPFNASGERGVSTRNFKFSRFESMNKLVIDLLKNEQSIWHAHFLRPDIGVVQSLCSRYLWAIWLRQRGATRRARAFCSAIEGMFTHQNPLSHAHFLRRVTFGSERDSYLFG